MAMFIHLASEKNVKAILRRGLRFYLGYVAKDIFKKGNVGWPLTE